MSGLFTADFIMVSLWAAPRWTRHCTRTPRRRKHRGHSCRTCPGSTLKQNLSTLDGSHRRRINTEEKAKIVTTAVWVTEFFQFLAALAVSHNTILSRSSFFSVQWRVYAYLPNLKQLLAGIFCILPYAGFFSANRPDLILTTIFRYFTCTAFCPLK